jgi:hypothetical protein
MLHVEKECIWWLNLFKKIKVSSNLNEQMTLYNDNLQTIKLLISEITKVDIKLRHVDMTQCWLRKFVQRDILKMNYLLTASLIVELSFEQKFKLDPRIEQTRQLNPWIEQLELDETELVTYKFLGFEQKSLFKPESWTEILVQLEDWIESSCSICSKPNSAATLLTAKMTANEIMKMLLSQKHNKFIKQLSLMNIKHLIEKKMNDANESNWDSRLCEKSSSH